MSFNDELLKDGRGRVIRIDASLDKFSTVAYRWGSAAGELDGSNMYSNRVMSLAPVRRGLGQNRVAGGGTCELVLANADGGLDALAGRESMSTQAKLRLRIYVCLFTPGAAVSLTSKLLGEFSLTGWVRRNNETLTLPLGDDVMGAVSQQAALPNFVDWQAVGDTSNNPIKNAMGLPNAVSEYSSIQLAFGEDWVLALPHVIPWNASDAAYIDHVIVPVCCTTDSGTGSDYEITSLRIQYIRFDGTLAIQDVPVSYLEGSTSTTLWRTERSPTITKDGKDFKVIYLVVSSVGLERVLSTLYDVVVDPRGGGTTAIDSALASLRLTGGYPIGAVDWAGPEYKRRVSRVLAWYVKGIPLSARTQTTDAIQHPVDVLTDLVSYYSNNTDITVNSTEAARVKAATSTAACAGVVQGWLQGPKKGDPSFHPPPSLRQTITAICQSSDIDCFIDWSGQFSFSTDFWDFTVASSGTASWTPDGAYQTSGNGVTSQYIPAVIPETWISGLEETLPSDGERWAPYNRLFLAGGKANPAEQQDPPFQGPYDFGAADGAAVAIADRIIEATLEQGWRPYRQQIQDPRFWRSLNVTARTVVRFRTHIGGLLLELGQYFALSWTRGPTLAGPYSGTIFQVEAITYAPGDDTVEVTAVWRQDVMTERQYILDDETLIVRAKPAAGTLTIADDATATISSGISTWAAMGVVAGDILIVRDSSEPDDEFERCNAKRVVSVDSATQLTVESAWDDAYVIADADWEVQRGATTYHTAVSDPTNYPLGGERYGKVTDSDGEYSNAETGNRLISG